MQMRRVQRVIFVLMLIIGVELTGRFNALNVERVNWYIGLQPNVLAAATEPQSKQMDFFRECANCPEMVVVPAGRFMMGSPQTEKGRFEYEGPQHEIVINRHFAVAKFEVMFEEWDSCVNGGGCTSLSDSGFGRGRQPVINVSREEAQHYAAWLSRITGQQYRLLSEAEWEYAARAGTDTVYFWGDEIGQRNANCNGCGSEWDRKRPAPVGSFSPNKFGLHDTTGNVWEWVEDCWHASYIGDPPRDGAPWTTDCPDIKEGIVRGGSWRNGPQGLRIALRSWYPANGRHDALGFRIARTLTQFGSPH